MNKIKISWKQYGILIDKLVKKIKESKMKFNGVYGIKRGGWPVAVALSHKLDLSIVCYPTKKTLIVEDITDTGKTLKRVRLKKAIACLHSTKWTKVKPDFFVEEKLNKDDWIIYPYEK